MDPLKNDARFKHVGHDPRFRRAPKKLRKINIDKRFKSLLEGEDYMISRSIDNRGRPLKRSSAENLRKFYNLSDENTDEDERQDEAKVNVSQTLANVVDDGEADESSEEEDDNGSHSDALSDAPSNGDAGSIQWDTFDMDRDAERSPDSSCRLAVCSMDWDRISATDIFMALRPLAKNPDDLISAKIYLSDFGKKCIETESKYGPHMGPDQAVAKADKYNGSEIDDATAQREALRRYQINRLRYYYAIVVFSSLDATVSVYDQAEMLGYETSGNRFDLRFVPDSETFDEDRIRESCDSVPELSTYKPSVYWTTALFQTKVDCTWDETPRDRVALVERSYRNASEQELANLSSLVVGDSEDSDENGLEELEKHKDEASKLKAFRDLLLRQQETGCNNLALAVRSDSDDSMEICWDDDDDKPAKKSKTSSKKKKWSDGLAPDNILNATIQDTETKTFQSTPDNPPRSKDKNKKAKKKNRKFANADDDGFKFDAGDDRFKGVFEDPDAFNIDPNDRRYRDSDNMRQLVTQSAKRRATRQLNRSAITSI